MDDDWQNGGFGIYLHWPFCQSKCPYCDFNSHVTANIDQDQWETAYLSEIARYAREFPQRIVNSVFFGGGTPSLMNPALVSRIIDAISREWRLTNDVEVTLEANPNSVESDRFRGFRAAGVNRISVGVQALNDADLKRLGRLHSAREALTAIETAQDVFDRISLDLIYARQFQTFEDWRAELATALALGTDHLSLYQLTIEDGTAFGKRHTAGNLPGLPDDDTAADMFALTQEMTERAGFAAYEISNHASPGAESRHNKIYWSGGDYVGIGPGAHGRLSHNGGRFATETALLPGAWLASVDVGNGESLRTRLTSNENAEEYLMMGLRVNEGISLTRLHKLDASLSISQNIPGLKDQGLVWGKDDRLGVTSKGRIILNAVIRELVSG